MNRAKLQITAVLVVAAAVGVVCVAHVWPFVADDAFISLRFADRLVAGDGLTWTDGERAEGYSNLAWVLACALLGAFGISTFDAARWLGIACGLATLALLARRFHQGPAAALPVIAAATIGFATWSIGGLELPLLLVLLTSGLLAGERLFAIGGTPRQWFAAGSWFAVAALTRPDAPLFAGVLALAAARSAGMTQAIAFAAPTAIALGGQFAFRIAYHGDWVANTARVKVGAGLADPRAGLDYLGEALLAAGGPIALASIGATLAFGRGASSTFVRALVAACLAWACYLVAIGGDFFPAFRMAQPVLPCVVLLAGLGVQRLATAAGRATATLTALGALVLALGQTFTHSWNRAAAEERWEYDGIRLGEALATAFVAERPLVAVDAAGAMPWASRLPSLDMYGLCDAEIARDPQRGGGATAHQRAHRRARPEMLLARAPDLLSFGAAPGFALPADEAGLALLDDPRFHSNYRCIQFEFRSAAVPGGLERTLHAPVWIRGDGRCGVRTTGDQVAIPAILLGAAEMEPGFRLTPPTDEAARAQWQRRIERLTAWASLRAVVGSDETGAWLEARQPGDYELSGIALPAGNWDLRVEPPLTGVTIELRDPTGAPLPFLDGRWSVEAATTTLVVRIGALATPPRLRTVVGRRG